MVEEFLSECIRKEVEELDKKYYYKKEMVRKTVEVCFAEWNYFVFVFNKI